MKLDPATTAKVLQACREGGTMPPGMAARYDAAMRKDEKDFQAAVIREAKRRLWKVYHTTISKRSDPGFPDLTLARERVIFAELKTETGRTSAAQENWLDALRAAGAEVYLWRPADMAAILRVLA